LNGGSERLYDCATINYDAENEVRDHAAEFPCFSVADPLNSAAGRHAKITYNMLIMRTFPALPEHFWGPKRFFPLLSGRMAEEASAGSNSTSVHVGRCPSIN
jgi:hypothetical protein